MKTLFATIGGAALLAAAAAQAHHSFSMFDPAREEVVEGTVTQWAYNSPHTLLFIEDAEGNPWVFEGAAPPAILGRSPSMSGLTFEQGQHVIVVHCPLRDGRSGGGVGVVITDDDTVYNASDAGCNAEERSEEWVGWVQAGYKSLAEAQAATGSEAPSAEATDEASTEDGAGEEDELADDTFTEDPAVEDAPEGSN